LVDVVGVGVVGVVSAIGVGGVCCCSGSKKNQFGTTIGFWYWKFSRTFLH
jgi:hypothetical protein